MLRISLIIAIIAGLAAGVVSFVKVQEVMKQTETDRNTYFADANRERGEKVKALASLKKTQGELATTKSELSSTQTQLKTTTAKANELEKQKNDLTANLQRVKEERDKANDELTKWSVLQVKPEEVRGMISDLAKTKKERAVFAKENGVLIQTVRELNNELLNFKDPDRAVQLPLELKGKILAVDPKYDFVVLDIGKDKHVLERGEMLVSRSGKLIAKIRIASVKENRSIANVMPGWKQDEVMEGDVLISSKVQ